VSVEKRLIYLRADAKRAHEALKNGEWWNGREWRPDGSFPRTQKEAAAYRSAHDRLAEIIDAMIGGDDQGWRRFDQSAGARKKRDPRKDEAQRAWVLLVNVYTKERLLAARSYGTYSRTLNRSGFRTRGNRLWTSEGVRSLIRRHK
jgi:hypothetical protein